MQLSCFEGKADRAEASRETETEAETDSLAEDFVDHASWSMKMEAKHAAEDELDRRDHERAKTRTQRLRDAARDVEDEKALKRERMYRTGGESDSDREESDEEEDAVLNIEAFDVPLREWITQERTRREIKRRFKDFLLNYSNEPQSESSELATVDEEGEENRLTVKPHRKKKKDLIYLSIIR